MNKSNRQTWQVISPIEGKEGKSFWQRVGSAWQRDDGGFSIQLNSIPLNGKLMISLPQEKTQRREDIPF